MPDQRLTDGVFRRAEKLFGGDRRGDDGLPKLRAIVSGLLIEGLQALQAQQQQVGGKRQIFRQTGDQLLQVRANLNQLILVVRIKRGQIMADLFD
jgi:hypothetical protein